jgi:hypothetical protein
MSLGSALRKITERRLLNADDYNELVVSNNEIMDEIEGIERTLAMMRRQDSGGGSCFFAMITDTKDADSVTYPVRWKYSWVQVEKDPETAGYDEDAWIAVDGGLTGDKDGVTAGYNFVEYMNDPTGTGLMGNGVNLVSGKVADTEMTLRPATPGVVVPMYIVGVGSAVEYWFSHENGVEGDCS